MKYYCSQGQKCFSWFLQFGGGWGEAQRCAERFEFSKWSPSFFKLYFFNDPVYYSPICLIMSLLVFATNLILLILYETIHRHWIMCPLLPYPLERQGWFLIFYPLNKPHSLKLLDFWLAKQQEYICRYRLLCFNIRAQK